MEYESTLGLGVWGFKSFALYIPNVKCRLCYYLLQKTINKSTLKKNQGQRECLQNVHGGLKNNKCLVTSNCYHHLRVDSVHLTWYHGWRDLSSLIQDWEFLKQCTRLCSPALPLGTFFYMLAVSEMCAGLSSWYKVSYGKYNSKISG